MEASVLVGEWRKLSEKGEIYVLSSTLSSNLVHAKHYLGVLESWEVRTYVAELKQTTDMEYFRKLAHVLFLM